MRYNQISFLYLGRDERYCIGRRCGELCANRDGMIQVMRYCQPDGSCEAPVPECSGITDKI